jgi:outer membrane receptor protein involved in Fe transport
VDVVEDFSRRVRGPNGEVLEHAVLNKQRVFMNYGYESFVGAKYDLFYQIHPQHELSAGIQILTARKWKNDVFVAPDTTRFDLNRDGIFETGPVLVPPMIFHQDLGFGNSSKYFFYASDKYKITPQLALTLGLRYDHFTYSGKGEFSPRGNISYQLSPGATTVTFAAGQYHQTQPFPFYSDRLNRGINKSLSNMRADHYVLELLTDCSRRRIHLLGN